MNRSELQDALIQKLLDSIDLNQLGYDYMDEGYEWKIYQRLVKYSDEELIAECEEYYPELLGDTAVSDD